jgi:elongation factor Ts
MSESIPSKLVMELRDRSGVGIGKCKEALVLAEGNMETAIEILRKKGLASAVKKAGRETREGLIGIGENEHKLALVEVNAETDFVVKNQEFIAFVEKVCKQAVTNSPESLDDFLKEPDLDDPTLTIDGLRNLLVQKVGENIQIKRVEIVHKEKDASYGIYKHMGGKITCVVEILGSKEAVSAAKDIAMHLAAEAPEYLDENDVPKNIKAKEEEIYRSQLEGKKPEHIIPKIIEGKMKSFYASACLLDQPFIKDSDNSVKEYLAKKGKDLGKTLSIQRFWRWKIGN